MSAETDPKRDETGKTPAADSEPMHELTDDELDEIAGGSSGYVRGQGPPSVGP